jgi:hypothetical protein
MLSRHTVRCIPFLAAAALAWPCAAQVLRDPGMLPNGRRIPFPDAQQNPPETTPNSLAPTPQPAGGQQQPPSTSVPAMPAVRTPPSLLDKPAQPAKVSLTDGQLSVTADNSSLTDILHQLAATSGMSIDGLDRDTRIFGSYGPGTPRDILSSLLEGAGYNVMMLGSTDAGTPRQLLLTVRSNATVVPQQASSAPPPDDDQDEVVPLNTNPPAGEAPPPPRTVPPVPQQNPNGSVKSPQELLQELQQIRQQNQQQPPQ